MVGIGGIAREAFEIFEEVHSIVTFYQFILEEAAQGVGMSVWVAYQQEDYDRMKMLARQNKEEILIPLRDFSQGLASEVSFPMNTAFESFAKAQIKAMDYYLELEPPKDEEESY